MPIKVMPKKWPKRSSLMWRPPRKCSLMIKNESNSIMVRTHLIQKLDRISVVKIPSNTSTMGHRSNSNFTSTEALSNFCDLHDNVFILLLKPFFIWRKKEKQKSALPRLIIITSPKYLKQPSHIQQKKKNLF